MAQEFIFRLHIQGEAEPRVFDIPIGSKPIVIGRQAGADLLLDHQQVSRRHATLNCSASECQITDMNSANGTRLNDEKLTAKVPTVLKHGDRIQIGVFTLEFEQLPVAAPEEIQEAQVAEWLYPPQAVVPPPMKEPELPPLTLTNFAPAPPAPRFDTSQPIPGLTSRSERLLGYLPSIYHTDFMASYLAIFEAILFPIEWQIDGFDLFLDPGTAPKSFLPWLANWFEIVFDSTWTEAQQRAFLKEAHLIYLRSGTRWSLSRILEIYSSCTPEIDDQLEEMPYTFRVRLPSVVSSERKHLERLIDLYKPAHTKYVLEFSG